MSSIATTVARVLIGGLFFGHGMQKLAGWFGGHGLDGTGQFFESIGLRPGRRQAAVAGAAEAGGGALLAAGLATPFAGAAITGAMVEAIRTVHAPKGPWVAEGGWEYNAVLIAAVAAIVESGGGALTLDERLGIQRRGTAWAALAVSAGLVGPAVVNKLSGPPPAAPAATGPEAAAAA